MSGNLIVFFVARFSYSGVPLAQLRLAKSFARMGYDVEVVFGCIPPGLELPQGIDFPVIDFRCDRVVKSFSKIFQYIKEKRPWIIFSAEDHLNTLVAFAAVMARSKAKISASSRVTPYDTYSKVIFSKRWFLKHLSRLAKRRITVHACVSKDMVDQYKDVLGGGDFQAIYNVVVDGDTESRMLEPLEEPFNSNKMIPTIVSAGRLAPEKGFSDLIRAMAIVLDEKDCRLILLGDGPLKKDLEKLIGDLGIGENVFLLGYKSNPLQYYYNSDIFVLSSYVEGLPNVLVEAMACGCTPVATDCPTGPREVLQDGHYGALVPVKNPQLLAEAILFAIDNRSKPESLAAAIRPFTESEVMNAHKISLGL